MECTIDYSCNSFVFNHNYLFLVPNNYITLLPGGEEGARYGPSLMPGGAPEAWPAIKPIFQSISAKVRLYPIYSNQVTLIKLL